MNSPSARSARCPLAMMYLPAVVQRPSAILQPNVLLAGLVRFEPDQGKQQSAVFQCLDLVKHVAIEHQKTARGELDAAACVVEPHTPLQALYGGSLRRVMRWNAEARTQGDDHEPKL